MSLPATCHPERRASGRGLCRKCYSAAWKRSRRDPSFQEQWESVRPIKKTRHATCHPDRTHYAHGLCLLCARKDIRAKAKAADPEGFKRAARENQLRVNFGITGTDWARMMESQGGRCAICRTDRPRGRGWQTDHDHATGVVRGVLCHGCNNGIGHLRESQEILHAAGVYLAKHSPPLRLVRTA